MIRYNLLCRKSHAFEAWFRDSKLYDEQAAAGEVRCPVCGSSKVEKALMAPGLVGSRKRSEDAPAPETAKTPPAQLASRAVHETEQAGKVRDALRELRRQVESNCDYVGPAFAEEARKIHYGETEERGIYGETSDEEAEALRDEGVTLQRVPWLPKEDS